MSFAQRVTPPAVRDAFNAAAAGDGTLQVTQMLLGDRIWDWFHTVGVLTHEELSHLLPAVPPVELRRITNSPDAAQFLWTGLVQAALMVGKYELHGRPNETAAVLDFGCGCGRLGRFLALRPDLWTVHACEVNEAHVSWLESHLPSAHPICSPLDPPLPYGSGQFDLVYALSVFTHLPPERAEGWLTELRRILKPGGVLVVTTAGAAVLDKASVSEEHARLLTLGQLTIEEAKRELQSEGFVYHDYPKENADIAGAGHNYGTALVTGARLGDWAGEGLEIVQHEAAGLMPTAFQDVTVMRVL